MKAQADQRYRILLVDDEPIVRRATTMLLTHDGHEVQAVESGEAALLMFAPGKFDLVITDNSMEGMSGGQLAALLKDRHPNQSIIMATAFVNMVDLSDAVMTGVELVLNKPFTHGELREAIARVMSQTARSFTGDLGCPIPLPPSNPRNVPRPSV